MTKKETASELMARLQADPDFVARTNRREAERLAREAELRSVQVPLVEELRRVGVLVDSVWDLVNTSASYLRALPVLLTHLHRAYPPAVREGIARALAVPAARFAWGDLDRLYRAETNEMVRTGLAAALAATAGEEQIDGVIALVQDKGLGSSRLILLSALERSSDPQALSTLLHLRTDPDFAKEVPFILRRLKHLRRRDPRWPR